jgi:hypothetical protein
MACSKFINHLILFFILLSLYAGCISTLGYPRELQKSERYQLQIDTSASLSDATFFIPLPVKHGGVMIGDKQLSADDFAKEGFSVDFIQTPPGFNMSGFYLGNFSYAGDDPWFLRIHADVWPKGRNEWFAADGAQDLSSPLIFYNTLYTVGNESVLLPKLEFSHLSTPKIQKKNSNYGVISFASQETGQYTMIYANYTANDKAIVMIFILIEGINSWRDMDDTNPSNRYADEVYGALNENKGWNKLSGTVSAAEGDYPDISSPRWQQFIQRNQQSATQK